MIHFNKPVWIKNQLILICTSGLKIWMLPVSEICACKTLDIPKKWARTENSAQREILKFFNWTRFEMFQIFEKISKFQKFSKFSKIWMGFWMISHFVNYFQDFSSVSPLINSPVLDFVDSHPSASARWWELFSVRPQSHITGPWWFGPNCSLTRGVISDVDSQDSEGKMVCYQKCSPSEDSWIEHWWCSKLKSSIAMSDSNFRPIIPRTTI